MSEEDRNLDRKLLIEAKKCLEHSGGTRCGQMCHFEAEVWHNLRRLVDCVLSGQGFCMDSDETEEEENKDGQMH